MLSSFSTLASFAVRFLWPLALTGSFYALWKLADLVWHEYLCNPLRHLPGPSNPSLLYGNMREIWNADNSVLHEQWIGEYGKTIKYKVFLGVTRLYTTDLKAINHILMNSTAIYQKPKASRFFLSQIVGNGVLVVEGEKHKEQRKIMNPAFGAAQIRELTEIFVEKALQLRDVWVAEIKAQSEAQPKNDKTEPEPASAKINVILGLSKMTLDVIGLAGFNYNFNTLSGERNELNEAFNIIFNARPRMSLFMILRGLLSAVQFLVPAEGDKQAKQARATMDRIGRELLRESKAALTREIVERGGNSDAISKERFERRDLLTLLLKANLAADGVRMSDEDVLSQVPTFLVAGHETTSNATTWALYALSLSPFIQTKLREELFTVSTDNPSMDELNALPYLDAVVRETLRVHAPVPMTMRVAVQDDVLPLGKPFVDRKGKVRENVTIRKGQTIAIPILAINRSKEIWGPDAMEFRPERWESLPEATASIPGVWGNVLTFLGGPRACIGYRFSIIETKALLFTLIRAFEFELAVPASEIAKKSSVVQRPVLKSDPKAQSQMPLLVRRYVPVD